MLTAHNGQRTTHDGQKAITKAHHEHVVLRIVMIIMMINDQHDHDHHHHHHHYAPISSLQLVLTWKTAASMVAIAKLRTKLRKTAPPLGGHIFQRTGIIFKLGRAIIRTNVLPRKLQNCPAPWWICFSTRTIFELS
ncbi:hypothetical protein DPMN_046194 [Dreissena polymorpha]|uniref:Uncharacterized protein n=1 Tax=Dreissena polymorpha TaxID=45954 RepID=A0A9D4HY00_DREPO|nr:hypothetical protein DPMN_046194 [Dreissena polymorpha]